MHLFIAFFANERGYPPEDDEQDDYACCDGTTGDWK